MTIATKSPLNADATTPEKINWLGDRYFLLDRDAELKEKLSRLFASDDAGQLTSVPKLDSLTGQIPDDEAIGTVTADGAYDTRRCHSAIIVRGGTAIVPIRKNGRPWKEDCPAARARNETLRATRHYGRAFWKRWTGYHARSRIEAKMRCLKSFGERIMARDPDRQTAEIHIRIASPL